MTIVNLTLGFLTPTFKRREGKTSIGSAVYLQFKERRVLRMNCQTYQNRAKAEAMRKLGHSTETPSID